jgi:NADPH-dependent ferric siderophore reductase
MPLLHVTAVHRPTPRLARVTFTADGLDRFWPDQQLKLLIPRPGHPVPDLPSTKDDRYGMNWYQAYRAIPEDQRPWLRSYTVRAHHADGIDIDFALHDRPGPATRWALQATPGDTIGRYGPSAVYARPLGRSDWILLAGDETALPAIATLVESLNDGVRAKAFIEVHDEAEEQPLATKADIDVRWVHRAAGDDLGTAVRTAQLPDGTPFAWLAGEATTVRGLRRHLLDTGLDRRQIDFTGYWRRGLSQDDPPTDEDLAEAQERVAD